MAGALRCATCESELDSRATFCMMCGATVPDPLVGAFVADRYVVERRFAVGGFGSIYRARDAATRTMVALKVMHRELASDEALVARFAREGRVLRSLRDPHTVATYETGETADGLPFIAMELLTGDTLLAACRAGGGYLPWPRALTIGRGVCSALAEAHGRGIVHRDLKPANIMVTEGDVAKVLDFGIARILASSDVSDPRELTRLGTAVGTLEYMAPEQLMGGHAEPRSDLYTLGVVLYEAITGMRPYPTAGLDLLTEQLAGLPPAASTYAQVPPALDALLAKCLAADVDERFATAADLARAIDAVIVAS